MRTRKEIDDNLLESTGQLQVRELVSNLPDDSLSLAWRSSLNEKLLVTAQKSRRRQMLTTWIMKPAFGLALAGAFAAVIMFRVSGMEDPLPVAQGHLEAALVREHQQNVTLSDVVGYGINPMESHPTEGAVSMEDWSEVDIDSL